MATKSETRCPTKRCVDAIEKYGEHYHGVHDDFPTEGITQCEQCGGLLVDGKWVHQCKVCKVSVEPGELTGLFVPHKCKGCEKKKADSGTASGAVCGMCRKPYSRCCC